LKEIKEKIEKVEQIKEKTDAEIEQNPIVDTAEKLNDEDSDNTATTEQEVEKASLVQMEKTKENLEEQIKEIDVTIEKKAAVPDATVVEFGKNKQYLKKVEDLTEKQMQVTYGWIKSIEDQIAAM